MATHASQPMSPDPECIELGIEEHRIAVESRDAAVLAWLTEFLAPAFHSLAPVPGAGSCRVRFEIAPARHAALVRAMAGAPTRSVEGFTLDGSFSRNLVFRAPDGRSWAHEEDGDAFLGVESGGRSVDVVVSRDASRPRVALMRVVRELATIALLRAGRLPLHAAAFVLDGRAVLVCGARRSGKTSLLVHALRCGAGFLSNDRVFTGPETPPVARAMPTIVMIRNGTLESFAELGRAFDAARFDRGRSIAECAPGIARPEPTTRVGDRPGISPAQLCRLLGAPMRGEAPLGAILFPRIDPGAAGMHIEPLQADRAAAQLARNLLVASTPARCSPLFAPDAAGRPIPTELHAEQCRSLAGKLPAFTCRLGADAFATDLRTALRRAAAADAASRPADAAPPPAR